VKLQQEWKLFVVQLDSARYKTGLRENAIQSALHCYLYVCGRSITVHLHSELTSFDNVRS
jgi:hypothetical protein